MKPNVFCYRGNFLKNTFSFFRGNTIFLLLLFPIISFSCKDELLNSESSKQYDIINISPEFEKHLILKQIDTNPNPNGTIKYNDIRYIDSLDITFSGVNNRLQGLEYFTNLRYLKLRGIQPSQESDNQYYYTFTNGLQPSIPTIDTLDVSKNRNLQYLDCSGRSDGGGYWSTIGHLKLGRNENLKSLIVQFSMIKSLDLSGVSSVENLKIGECYYLKRVDLCNNTRLKLLESWQVDTFLISSFKEINPDWTIGKAKFQLCK